MGSGHWKWRQLKGAIIRKMDCHYFDSWSLHRWIMWKSWLALICQLNIVGFFFNIFNICRILLACAVGRAWTGDSPSNRFEASSALIWHSSVPGYNQLGDHGDPCSYCFPESIVHTVYSIHFWFRCFGHGADRWINANVNKFTQNWNYSLLS